MRFFTLRFTTTGDHWHRRVQPAEAGAAQAAVAGASALQPRVHEHLQRHPGTGGAAATAGRPRQALRWHDQLHEQEQHELSQVNG